MALQLSLERARALGILAKAGLEKLGGPPAAPTAAKAALDAALAPRRSAKGGRHARILGEPVEFACFDVDHPPRTKQRARTQVSKKAIVTAFLQARGDVRRFAQLLDAIPSRSFTPKSTKDFENAVMEAAKRAMGDLQPVKVPVKIEVTFTFEGDAGKWPTDVTDADLDNLEKAVLDGLNAIAYHDDRLVVSKEGIKLCGPLPGVRIRILRFPG